MMASLHDMLSWLETIELRAQEAYQTAARKLGDAQSDYAAFFGELAENEADHAALLRRLGGLATVNNTVPPSHITLTPTFRHRIEKPLQLMEAELSNPDVDPEFLFSYLADVELSEWNDLFMYVVETFKDESPETGEGISAIQDHEDSVKTFLAQLPAELRPARDISTLKPVWKDRFLVVEDNAPLRKLLGHFLEDYGETVTAADGEQGLEEVTHHFFNAVITDLSMPGLDGLSLYKRAATAHPSTTNDRFVFMSFEAAPGDLAYIRSHGLSFLQKPFDPFELVTIVQAMAHPGRDMCED